MAKVERINEPKYRLTLTEDEANALLALLYAANVSEGLLYGIQVELSEARAEDDQSDSWVEDGKLVISKDV